MIHITLLSDVSLCIVSSRQPKNNSLLNSWEGDQHRVPETSEKLTKSLLGPMLELFY